MKRIGLRYINECPVPSKDNASFSEYYTTAFPLERFHLENASEMTFATEIKRGQYFVRYLEAVRMEGGKPSFTLDIDAYCKEIKAKDCLPTADKLHTCIHNEYQTTIKEPVREFMRQR